MLPSYVNRRSIYNAPHLIAVLSVVYSNSCSANHKYRSYMEYQREIFVNDYACLYNFFISTRRLECFLWSNLASSLNLWQLILNLITTGLALNGLLNKNKNSRTRIARFGGRHWLCSLGGGGGVHKTGYKWRYEKDLCHANYFLKSFQASDKGNWIDQEIDMLVYSLSKTM